MDDLASAIRWQNKRRLLSTKFNASRILVLLFIVFVIPVLDCDLPYKRVENWFSIGCHALKWRNPSRFSVCKVWSRIWEKDKWCVGLSTEPFFGFGGQTEFEPSEKCLKPTRTVKPKCSSRTRTGKPTFCQFNGWPGSTRKINRFWTGLLHSKTLLKITFLCLLHSCIVNHCKI